MTPSDPKAVARIAWVDVAKGIGIALVFYGHFVQRFIDLGVPAATAQMRWIYSFHMPLFFFLVGLVHKDREISFGAFMKREVRTRLIPAWVFNIVGMFIWVAVEYARGESGWVHEHGWPAVARYCANQTFFVFVHARPNWNLLTWFLFCLFMIEVWQFGLRHVVRSNRRLALSILSFATLATIANSYSESIASIPFWGAFLSQSGNAWQVASGLAAMSFYQLGILVRRVQLVDRVGSGARLYVLAAICLAVTFLGDNLNDALNKYPSPIVLMIDAKYGDMWCFFLASLAGTFFVVCISKMLSASRLLNYIGQITLALMCLDGILHKFVNAEVAAFIVRAEPARNVLLLTGICLLGTALSLLVCLPANWLLERYLPFVLGRSKARAPRPSPPPLAGANGPRPA
jgi:acyltransferase